MMGRKSASLGLVRKLAAFVACLALMLVFIPTQANASSDGKFVAGHTYSVPMTVYKDGNSSETSMADGFLESYALVTPNEDLSKLSITFTILDGEFYGTPYVDLFLQIRHNDVDLTIDVGNLTFAIEVDYTESDLVVPLDLLIKPMYDMGMGFQTADFWIYLSQAIDLTPSEDEGDTNEGDTNEGDTNEGDTNEGDTNEGDTNEEASAAFVAGHTYSAPLTVYKDGNSSETSMADTFFDDYALITPNDDLSKLSITFTVLDESYSGLPYKDGVSVPYKDLFTKVTYNGSELTLNKADRTFTIEVDYTQEAILVAPLGMVIEPMALLGQGEVFADFWVYLSEAVDLKTGENVNIPGTGPGGNNSTGGNRNGGSSSSNNSGSSTGGGATTSDGPTTLFVAGHTYSVPMTVYKDGSSSDLSMAAQYFGDTAYVRPSDDLSTLSISFTTSGLNYIESLTYNGSAVSLSGSTFTIEVPYTESDLVVPLDMVITPMKELGMGTVTADFHFYLSQATDLGTDVNDNAIPSASNTTLASTGANVATGIAAALILTATGCVLAVKRRLFRF